jgi:hypothetical protein
MNLFLKQTTTQICHRVDTLRQFFQTAQGFLRVRSSAQERVQRGLRGNLMDFFLDVGDCIVFINPILIILGRANRFDEGDSGWREGRRGANSMLSGHKTIIGHPTLQISLFARHWRDTNKNDSPTPEGRKTMRGMGN